jgi:spore maturation protein CgeB
MKKYKRKGLFYLQELARCKIGLNFRGAGWDTLRYWEIPALGGFMISQRPQIMIENNYIDGEEIVFCKDDLSDLIELCEYYLEHEDERKRIANNSKKKTEAYHTDTQRALYIKQKIEYFKKG